MSSSSSSSPSSSAVTIARPGKSILKKPPPPPQSFFSLTRLSRLLPTPAPVSSSSSSSSSDVALKRAHFYLPHLTTVYPISAANPPCGPNIREEKKSAELREAERRRRIVRGNSISPGSDETEDWWSLEKVEAFYRECCEGCDEVVNPSISASLKHTTNPRSLDLSGIQLTPTSAATLSDVFAVEWGLRKVVFRECDLDEHTLKPMLHALLIPSTLSFLSVASNRRLKAPAFRIIGAYLHKAKSVQFLDLSQNILDKKSMEYIVEALAPATEQGLESLRLDDCSIRPAALETLAQAVRKSSLRNISLRHNRITASGSVALAILIKDYPDTVVPSSSLPSSPPPSSPSSSTPSLSSTTSTAPPPSSALSPPPTPTSPTVHNPLRTGPIAPPPRHPSSAVQTTYTPYIPRARRGVALPPPNPLSATGQHVPLITSSARGGVTTRHPVPPSALPSPQLTPSSNAPLGSHPSATGAGHRSQGPSAALLDKVRALDALPRLGELRTLDLRGNDIRGGVTYIAQVLKRNRTLKVLNLSENKIDVQGLVVIAEALKYNSNLETLDLSRNPCSGPSLEGIQSLRTAFTLNTSLKRLFLSSTSMSSAGAIALAEFLPESASLLHLDLTVNNLELAGVMALSEGLKSNHTMRCLDLNIPPGDEEYARMCRDILNTCIRNTEEAEKNSQMQGSGRGLGKGVWGMIEESELAKTFRQGEEKKSVNDIVAQARECHVMLQEQLSRAASSSAPATSPVREVDEELRKRVKTLLPSLIAVIQTTADPAAMDELLELNDSLTSLCTTIEAVPALPNGFVGHDAPAVTMNGSAHTSRSASPMDSQSDSSSSNSSSSVLSSRANGGPPALSVIVEGLGDGDEDDDDDDDEADASTPKVDKGKGRAEPEPEEPEKVLSPSFLIASDDEDEEGHKALFVIEPEDGLGVPSPTDRSRSWVEEEGEVFRKGNALLGPEEMEGEYDGEELRIELLETEVERPPPRPINVNEFGLDSPPSPISANDDPLTPTEPIQESKPSPRPYLPRSRSSSSSIQLASPIAGPGQDDKNRPPRSPQVMSPISPSSARPYAPRRRSSSNAPETN